MARKHVDPLKAKQKKQKILAAGLGVAFVGLLVFQVPRVMKQLHPPPPRHSSSATPTAAPVSGTPSLAAPTLRGAAQTPAAASSDPSLAAAAAPVQDGQLASFSRFASKDPFAQQLSENGASSSGSSGGSSSSGSGSGGSTPAAGGTKERSSGIAVISVNGTLYSVPVGTDFPQASATDQTLVPVFHLVSLTAHSAKISIVGGSYSSGTPTVTLQEKKTVTLMNTADGTRYKITLMPQGTEVASTATTTTTPATVTIPPASP
jgi:hypothetical protein